MNIHEMLSKVISKIEGWNPGEHFVAHYDNDGDGHYDFGYMEVTDLGRQSLLEALQEGSIEAANPFPADPNHEVG